MYGGIPVCGDASLVAPLHGDGTPWARAATHDGAGIERARQLHEDRYPELLSGDRGRPVVLGTETGGRWAPEALTILRNLAEAKSRASPELLRRSAQVVWYQLLAAQTRLRMLSVAAQTALVETLLRPSSPHLTELDGHAPDLSNVLCVDRESPAFSRLPPR